jgi:hypothetical protein
MDWIQGVFKYIEKIWQWFYCFFQTLWCQGADFIMNIFEEVMSVVVTALSVIPIPNVIASFQWPDAGPFGYALIDLGVPQGLAILSAAFMIRFLKGLIPLIRS